MSTTAWDNDPLMGPVLADLVAIRGELADFHSEMNVKLTELSKVANASAGEVVTVQSETTRADYTIHFR